MGSTQPGKRFGVFDSLRLLAGNMRMGADDTIIEFHPMNGIGKAGAAFESANRSTGLAVDMCCIHEDVHRDKTLKR